MRFWQQHLWVYWGPRPFLWIQLFDCKKIDDWLHLSARKSYFMCQFLLYISPGLMCRIHLHRCIQLLLVRFSVSNINWSMRKVIRDKLTEHNMGSCYQTADKIEKMHKQLCRKSMLIYVCMTVYILAVKLNGANYQIWQLVGCQNNFRFKKNQSTPYQCLFLYVFLSLCGQLSLCWLRAAQLIFTALLCWLMHWPVYNLSGRKPVNTRPRLFNDSGK